MLKTRKICSACYSLFLFLLFSLTNLFAAEVNYPVSEIPVNLIKDAHLIIREYHTELKIISKGEAVKKVKKVMTVLSEKGREDGFLIIGYDKFIKVNYIKGNIYDDKGKLINKIKSSDIEDISSISGISIFEDDRLKVYKPKTHNYPYTVEYEYEINTRGLLTYSTWYPIASTETSLVKATFQINVPKDIMIRYMERNNVAKPEISTDAKVNNVYLWKIENLPVIKLEEKGPDPFELIPKVMIGPYEFEMEGYKGNFSSWQSMGEWINKLNAGRDVLSENTINTIKNLVKNEPDDLSKARKVYEYLQNNTRYVSIQLGIGGLQPFEASRVEKNGYGDCKALTNYTRSLLKVAGIESYYTLVNAGSDASAVVEDFSSLQFNHAFLCLPINQDTVWLECTNQQVPFGYLGHFTNDRHVLVINDKGGTLVRTPATSPFQNLQYSKINVKLQPNGHASAEVSIKYSGEQYNNTFGQLRRTPEEQKKWLYKNIDIPSFEIAAFNYKNDKYPDPTIREDLKLNLPNYASVSGKRIFLAPNLMNKQSAPSAAQERTTDLFLKFAYHDIDSIVYTLPEGFYPESSAEDVQITTDFGDYSSKIIFSENKIVYIRKITMFKGRYPASSYISYNNFIKDISKADRIRIVLASKT